VIKPTSTRRSRRGTHGENYYTHEHELRFILLHSSNSGKREIIVPDIMKPVQKDLEELWVYKGVTIKEIVEFVSSYLSKL
jgi:hypothetical protein